MWHFQPLVLAQGSRFRGHPAGRTHVPIIALTAAVSDTERQLAVDAGMDGFVSKPVHRNELARMLGDAKHIKANASIAAPRAAYPSPGSTLIATSRSSVVSVATTRAHPASPSLLTMGWSAIWPYCKRCAIVSIPPSS